MTDPTSLPDFNAPSSGDRNGSGPASTDAPGPGAGGGDSDLRRRVVECLDRLGGEPSVDADGDVAYTVSEQRLFVRVMEGDVPLLRVFGQWQVTDDLPGDLHKRLLAANDVSLSLNIIKVGLANGSLVVTGEHLLTEGSDLDMLLQSTTQMVLQAVQLWNLALNAPGPHVAEGGVPQLPGLGLDEEGRPVGQGGEQA